MRAGILDPDSEDEASTVRDAIQRDPLLTAEQKQTLLAGLRQLPGPARGRCRSGGGGRRAGDRLSPDRVETGPDGLALAVVPTTPLAPARPAEH